MPVISDESIRSLLDSLQNINQHLTPIAENLSTIVSMDVPEATSEYVRYRAFHDMLKSLYEDVSVQIKEKLANDIIPEIFERKDITSFTLKNGSRVTVQTRCTASIKDKEKGYDWLRNNELGDIIVETVNASTLAATAKAFKEEHNKDLPTELFTVTYRPSASVTKGKVK